VDNEHRTWSITRENDRTLTLHVSGGLSQDIKIADIKSRQDTALSLVPEGLEALGADTLRDFCGALFGRLVAAATAAAFLHRLFTGFLKFFQDGLDR